MQTTRFTRLSRLTLAVTLTLLVGQGLKWAVLGLVIGLAAGGASTTLLASLLYGVSALDPVAYAVAAAVLLAVAGVAAFVPALGASRLDPLRALRTE